MFERSSQHIQAHYLHLRLFWQQRVGRINRSSRRIFLEWRSMVLAPGGHAAPQPKVAHAIRYAGDPESFLCGSRILGIWKLKLGAFKKQST